MFTIIVTTHDRPLLLRRALRSLLNQTYQNFQVIIVSDSSAYIPPYEELLELTGRYTYIIRSGIPGPAESRNLGVQLATSTYVMFLDDDDTLQPDHLECMLTYINESSPAILFCNFNVIDEDRAFTPPKHISARAYSLENISRESVFVRNNIPNSCLMYRNDVVKNNTHDSSMRIYEDWDFLLACLTNFKLTHVPSFSVSIHKTIDGDANENKRRGNTRSDLVVSTTLELYKKYPAPSEEIKHQRKVFFKNAGFDSDLNLF